MRAITETTGRVRCEARIVHTGGTIATAEARVVGADGTLYAHGTSTCMILSPR
ncbi:MAG TPA: hotdog domain-containing protein [Kofleriaceae bacterium]|nr:hotdog domain-containing protein [Kofleriaceae bacterium]